MESLACHPATTTHSEMTPEQLDAAGVTLTANMRVRFTANDSDPQTINESGLDGFMILQETCAGGDPCGDLSGENHPGQDISSEPIGAEQMLEGRWVKYSAQVRIHRVKGHDPLRRQCNHINRQQ
jgi:hypothetical protein